MAIIELIGRKKTMAVEFAIFSVFVFFINICVTRFVLNFLLFFTLNFNIYNKAILF